MRSLPIDTSALSFVAIEVVPKVDQAGKQQTEDETNHLAWTVRVLAQFVGDSREKPEVLEVRIFAPVAPQVAPLTPIEFARLGARPWNIDGRSGTSFSAESVRSATGIGNGRKAEAVAPS